MCASRRSWASFARTAFASIRPRAAYSTPSRTVCEPPVEPVAGSLKRRMDVAARPSSDRDDEESAVAYRRLSMRTPPSRSSEPASSRRGSSGAAILCATQWRTHPITSRPPRYVLSAAFFSASSTTSDRRTCASSEATQGSRRLRASPDTHPVSGDCHARTRTGPQGRLRISRPRSTSTSPSVACLSHTRDRVSGLESQTDA
jgi:hypothetical protein